MTEYWATVPSPIGTIIIRAVEGAITQIEFVDEDDHVPTGKPQRNELVRRAEQQLREYFRGLRTEFDLPLSPAGTDFQKRVWKALHKIRFGATKSYGDLARTLRQPQAARAVGGACGRNPIAIVTPCHRVVGSTGRLTGYGGGVWRKEWLLMHEARHAEADS